MVSISILFSSLCPIKILKMWFSSLVTWGLTEKMPVSACNYVDLFGRLMVQSSKIRFKFDQRKWSVIIFNNLLNLTLFTSLMWDSQHVLYILQLPAFADNSHSLKTNHKYGNF